MKPNLASLREEVSQLSNEFYELIPFDFGRRRPDGITTTEQVAAHFEMLDVMEDIGEVMGMLEDETDDDGERMVVGVNGFRVS